tara:strand:- start:239 stop:763 length:525 start_codon:yes stop_codon:yes gene_type:complete
MKKLLSILSLVAVGACATPAAAETATVTHVEPNWIEVVRTVPVKKCSVAQVPIYEQVNGQGATGLDVLFGTLFGGLAGKALTDKDEGAVAGAVIGGVVAAEAGRSPQLRIVGYEDKEICTNRYVQRTESVPEDYTIQYDWNGYQGWGVVDDQYIVGDEIEVNVSVTICRSQNCN